MSMTFTVDPDFIYAMLKEYNTAVMAKNIGGNSLDEMWVAILQDGTEKLRGSFNCSVSAVPGGAKIECSTRDTSTNAYTANGAAYRYGVGGNIYELFRVSFSPVTKGSNDTLTVYGTAVLTVG